MHSGCGNSDHRHSKLYIVSTLHITAVACRSPSAAQQIMKQFSQLIFTDYITFLVSIKKFQPKTKITACKAKTEFTSSETKVITSSKPRHTMDLFLLSPGITATKEVDSCVPWNYIMANYEAATCHKYEKSVPAI